MLLYTQYISSPIGPITIEASESKILALKFEKGEERVNDLTREAIEQLHAYFARKLKVFNLPLQLSGSAFHQQIMTELLQIPYGTTITYQALSKRIGNPLAIRAVARANASNKIPIFIPCHRVIGVNGQLTGYSGGLDAKKYLLLLENNLSLF